MNRIAILALLLAAPFGCTSLQHGWTIKQYQGRLLSTSDTDGAKRLILEKGHDVVLNKYVQDWGEPDFIYVADMRRLYLIYIHSRKYVLIERPIWSSYSMHTEIKELPGPIAHDLNSRSEVASSTPDATKDSPGTESAAPESKPLILYGSGFVVSDSGHVLTCFHIVSESSAIEIYHEGLWWDAQLLAHSQTTDLALLQINHKSPRYLSLLNTSSDLVGQKVYTFGYPAVTLLGFEPKYSEGVVSALSGIEDDNCLMQISVSVQPGNSGGPLLNSDGKVVGIITSSAAVFPFLAITGAFPQNVSWAVKSDYAIPMLAELRSVPTAQTMEVSDIKRCVCIVKGKGDRR